MAKMAGAVNGDDVDGLLDWCFGSWQRPVIALATAAPSPRLPRLGHVYTGRILVDLGC